VMEWTAPYGIDCARMRLLKDLRQGSRP
jgi:hypothetical protein